MSNLQMLIRHPDEIPLDLQIVERPPVPADPDIPLGLVCHTGAKLKLGQQISIIADGLLHCPDINGEVGWCYPHRGGFQLGILFPDSEHAMRMRMFEQVCQIRRYRNWVHEQQGRLLTEDEAALEWIAKYAALFPSNDL